MLGQVACSSPAHLSQLFQVHTGKDNAQLPENKPEHHNQLSYKRRLKGTGISLWRRQDDRKRSVMCEVLAGQVSIEEGVGWAEFAFLFSWSVIFFLGSFKCTLTTLQQQGIDRPFVPLLYL